MKTSLKEIGARIEIVIKKAGVSRAALGEMLGIKEGAVGRHIRGETDPGTAALVTIAELGGVSLDWLITGKETPKPKEEMTDDEIIAEALIRPGLQNRIFAAARNQVREEMPPCGGGVIGDLVKAARQLPGADLVQLLDNAQYMIYRNESRRKEEGGSDCAETKSA